MPRVCLVILFALGPLLAALLNAEVLPSPEDIEQVLRDSSVRTLYVVSSSHWDLGFNDPTDVVQDRVKGHLDEVIENCTRDPQLRWTIESAWQALEWLKRTPDLRKQKRFFDLIREGRIGLSAAFGGMHTGKMSMEELCRFLYPGQDLAAGRGLVLDTAMMDDVPGYSWALSQVLPHAGVRFFLTGVNTRFGGRLKIPLKDRPFWWTGRDGSRLLTWICDGYNEAARTYHLPPTTARFFADAFRKPWLKKIKNLDRIQDLGMASALKKLKDAEYQREYLLTISSMDFLSSDRALELRKWIGRWNTRHPRPQIVQVTPSQFFHQAVDPDDQDFPSYSGDFSGLWETGHAIAPSHQANLRSLRNSLPILETLSAITHFLDGEAYPRLRIDDAWRNLLQCHEHGFGLGVGWPKLMTRAGVLHMNRFGVRLAEDAAERTRFLLGRHVRSIGERARTKAPCIIVFNPLPWPRSSPVSVVIPSDIFAKPFALEDESGNTEVTYDMSPEAASVSFVATDLPPFGYRRYRIRNGKEPIRAPGGPVAEKESLSGGVFRLILDPSTGFVVSLKVCSTGRELLERNAPSFGRLLRRSHQNDFLGRMSFVPADLGEPELSVSNRSTFASLIVRRSRSPLSEVKWTHYRGLDFLVADLAFDVSRTRHVPRAEHSDHYFATFGFGFSPEGAQYRFDGPAGSLDVARDFLPGALRGRAVVHHLAQIRSADGLILEMASPDAGICYFGPNAGRSNQFAPRKTELLWKLFSDADEGVAKDIGLTRYPPPDPASPVTHFRFALRLSQGDFDAASSHQFGLEQSVPVIARYLPPAVKPLFRALPTRRPASCSFLRVIPANVALLAMKFPEDRSKDDVILRLMEISGRATKAQVQTLLPLVSAHRCNVLERADKARPVPVSPLSVQMAPYELVTIRARVDSRHYNAAGK